ncbi:hypothetical protein [Paenibacillus chitinolyticus]|uniref:hypothetical protein n=1 Tax=Paenibacillus chitinolyticus TaxID=79263 RepID=UPI003672EEAF
MKSIRHQLIPLIRIGFGKPAHSYNTSLMDSETDAAYVEFDNGETISVTVGLLVKIEEDG